MRISDIAIDHPTNRPNFALVDLDNLVLAFSYSTLIGINFRNGEGWKVRVNEWGPTTGGHLNYLDPDKGSRLTAEDFAAIVEGLTLGGTK